MTTTDNPESTFEPRLAIAIDPELNRMLPGLLDDFPEFTYRSELVTSLRALSDRMTGDALAALAIAEVEVEGYAAPGPAGAPDVELTVIRPAVLRMDPSPVVFFIHGGGMVAGNRYLCVDPLVALAERYGITGISVEYRLAPEHPYPAQLQDCYAGLRWVVENSASLGLDSERIIVGGASAGGNLAAALALMARDFGGPAIAGSLLVSPMLDDQDASISVRQHERAVIWDRTANRTAWNAFLGPDREQHVISRYASPSRATDLSGLPPTFLEGGSAELFRDEIVDYATRIWSTGGSAEMHIWGGAFHGFDAALPDAAVSEAARAARTAWILRTLNG